MNGFLKWFIFLFTFLYHPFWRLGSFKESIDLFIILNRAFIFEKRCAHLSSMQNSSFFVVIRPLDFTTELYENSLYLMLFFKYTRYIQE